MAPDTKLPVILFGYESSPFTNKVRLALRLKQIPFSYIPVPSMLPRHLLTTTFALPYRKIPILALGPSLYCDTSLIIEALEYLFPANESWGTVYPDTGRWDYRGLARGFASFWIDRPFFRVTTGLMPPAIWSTAFGVDRAQLIGHPISAAKIAAKVPDNLAALDTHLSLLEPALKFGTWVFPTAAPSLADVALYIQLRWGMDMSSGKGVENLTGGDMEDGGRSITGSVFSKDRFPGVWAWFQRFEKHIASLPDLQTEISPDDERWKEELRKLEGGKGLGVVPAGAGQNTALDERRGLVTGAVVSVAPDDTGRGNPTVGRLVEIGVEEVIIRPLERGEIDVDVHFPRVGFTVKVVDSSKL